MTKKIFTGVISVSLIIMLVCVGLVMGIMYDYMGQKLDDQLAAEAILVEDGWKTGGQDYLDELEQQRNMKSRVTVLSPDGKVLYDSAADSSKMENHMQREEVKKALAEGEGYATRTSYTLSADMRYYAKKMDDGSIVRIAISHNSQMRLLLDTSGMIILTLAVLVALSGIISYRVAKAIIKPINDIDLDNPDITETYDELGPLLHRIHQQNTSIRIQMANLRKAREEFNIITENMSEGLLIIGKDTEILSYNPGALRMLRRGEDAVAEIPAESVSPDTPGNSSTFAEKDRTEGSVFRLNRSEPFRNAVNAALSGKSLRQYMESAGETYEIIANPVKEDRQVTGAILILMDVTERERGECLRREFTSNVSHELKTPLTSIYGVSDMLQSGLVKDEDVKDFAGTIKKESSRLISLIDDIIRLSQLDENTIPQEMETVDLWEITQQAAMRLSGKAEENQVTVRCAGVQASIRGVEYIVDEIVYNLCENAIKYNKKGGDVKVTVRREGGKSILTVVDNGIGIPKEDQDRVFERFYRVDKSHSRKIGGTGLGLSIVKHAVSYLGGEIFLESVEGEGTTVTVTFPAV